MQKGLAKTLANPLQERKRQDSNLRTALGRSTVFEAASFSHSDTLPVILLVLCPKLSQSPSIPPTPFSRGRSGPTGFPSPLGLPCSPTPARHLMMPCYFIGTLSQTLTLRAAFASSTYLLSQIPGPGRSSDDDLLNPPDPLFKGAIRAYGLSIAACLPCSPAPARHLMMPCYFIGTLSQTISIPLTPFSRGHIRPSCAPELGAIASLFFGRHLMMPWFPKEFR